MRVRIRSKRAAAGIALASSFGLVAAGMFVTAGIGLAVPISKTFQYTCPFPMIGNQQVSVMIKTDMPTSVTVGQPTGEFDIHAVSNAGEEATKGLNLVGAKTIEGDALADANINSPDGNLNLKVPNDIPKQPIPESGDLILDAFGNTPSLTFRNPGTAVISLGNLLLTLTPRDENGEETGLGTFESACTMNAGQDKVLHKFEITDGGGGTDTGGTDTGGTDTGGTDTGGTDTGGTDTGGTDTGGTDTGGTDGGGGGEPIKLAYDLKGSSHVEASDGTVPITGDIQADFDLSAETYEGDLKLDPTTGTFNAYGMFPAESDMRFVQTRKTTGTYDGNTLTSSSEMYIYLDEVRASGYPIGGGPDCRTVEPVLVDMQGENFDPFTGGKLAGEYVIPDFENCGQNTSMINDAAAGPGNTIDLTLTPKDPGGGDTGGTDTGGTDTGGTDAGGFDQGGYGDYGGYDQGGFGDFGGFDQGGFGDFGGFDQGGFGDFGGFDQGGFGDFGGFDQGGFGDYGGVDQGGYDQGGYDQGGYGDYGGYDQGGFGGGWGG